MGLLRRRAAVPVSERARALRLLTWGCLLLAGLALGLLVAGTKGWVPRETTGSTTTMFVGLLLAATWTGLRAQRQAVADRERESERAMVIVLAAQLGQQDDNTLARMVANGGPAGEAAAGILAGRRNPKASAATPSSSRSTPPRPRSTPPSGR